MQLIKTLSVLAIASGAVVAMPANVQKRQWTGINRWWHRPDANSYVTVTGYAPAPTDWDASPTSSTTSTSTTTVEVVASTPTYGGDFFNPPSAPESTPTETPEVTYTYTPPTQTWAPAPTTETPTATATAAPAPPSSGGSGGYMDIVNQWRSAGGLPSLTQDSTLEGNALKTSTDSTNGLEHELNPGTFAQVLAPGTFADFESIYVGGWLCEIPSLPGLNGICSTEAQGWDHSDGETGHADILTSTKYTKIGCASSSSTQVMACDLA